MKQNAREHQVHIGPAHLGDPSADRRHFARVHEQPAQLGVMSRETGRTLLETGAKSGIVIEEGQSRPETEGSNTIPPFIEQGPPWGDLSDGRHEAPPIDSVSRDGFDRIDLELLSVTPDSDLAADRNRISPLEPQDQVGLGRPEGGGLDSASAVPQGKQGVGCVSAPELDLLYQKDIGEAGAREDGVQRGRGNGEVSITAYRVTIPESGVISIGSTRLPISQGLG